MVRQARFSYHQIYPRLFSTNSHIVRENALSRVVIITVQAVMVPSCFMFFAMTKQLHVVALPSIMRMAMSFSVRNPSQTAAGRNRPQNRNSFTAEMPSVSPSLPLALFSWNDAPRAISASGVHYILLMITSDK